MKNRIFRFLVCLVLVCVILVNCSPIRAEATGVEALYLSTVFVNPTIAVTAVLFGLGVMVTAAATAVFTKLVDDITVDMVDKGLISSQGVDMYRADADGAATYLVNQELVEAVREYLFEKDVVSETSSAGYAYYNGVLLPELPFSYGYDIIGLNGDYILISFKSNSGVRPYAYDLKYSYDGSPWAHALANGRVSGAKYIYDSTSSAWVLKSTFTVSDGERLSGPVGDYYKMVWTNCNFSTFKSSDPVSSIFSVADGLVAGTIAGQNQSFADGYSEWASGAKTLPTLRDGVQTDAESAYIALGMGLTQEETMAMTQAAVQSGVGTYEGTGTATDAVTATGLKGWLDTIRLTLVSGFSDLVDGLLSGISSLFVPSAEAMAAQQDKWTTLLSDRFGAVYDSVALIDNIAGAFTLGATQTQIRFPLITIPFGDVSWEFGGWMVDVVPDGFQVLVDALKVGIDILCTLAFVNAMKHRFDRVLEGRG